MKYKIIDSGDNERILFESDSKLEAEQWLCRYLYIGHDAYIIYED